MPWMTRKQVRSQPVESRAESELQKLLADFDARMNRLNDEYLRMMGVHIREIGTMWPSDVHRLQQIRRMNRNLQQLQRRIADAAEMSESEINEVFRHIAEEDARMATKILGVSDAVSVKDNLPLKRILEAQARETAGRMRNLSNTTVVSGYYRNAVDEAVSAVQSGVEDYNTAIRRVIRDAGANGLRVTDDGTQKVDYESGWSRRLDTAARMNVLDGVRHMNQSIMEEVGRQFGANGVEIDAHMLCAEDHLPYQGQQFSNEEFEEIQDSLPRPFGEWNCRHSWHGIILGVSPPAYTADELEEMRRYSTEKITADGRTRTRYQWSQEMRRCETAIRQQKDTANLARAIGDKALVQKCQENIGFLTDHYKDITSKTGIGTEYQRTYVPGFKDAKYTKALTSNSKRGTIVKEDIQILRSLGAKAIYGDIRVVDLKTMQEYSLANNTSLRQVVVFAGKGTEHEYRNAWKYANKYGGDIDDWQHVKGRGWLETEEGIRPAAIHWSECEGIGPVEFFVKKWLDE